MPPPPTSSTAAATAAMATGDRGRTDAVVGFVVPGTSVPVAGRARQGGSASGVGSALSGRLGSVGHSSGRSLVAGGARRLLRPRLPRLRGVPRPAAAAASVPWLPVPRPAVESRPRTPRAPPVSRRSRSAPGFPLGPLAEPFRPRRRTSPEVPVSSLSGRSVFTASLLRLRNCPLTLTRPCQKAEGSYPASPFRGRRWDATGERMVPFCAPTRAP